MPQSSNQQAALQAVKYLEESPMDLTLLKDSGIGKTVKKFLSKSNGRLDFLDEPYVFSTGKDIRKTPRSTLQATLNSWMEMAAKSGVKMKSGDSAAASSSSPKRSVKSPTGASGNTNEDTVDLSLAKKCHAWRDLYNTLKLHDEKRRNRQGEKMRERRERLDKVRPKIVKVRHASAKQDGMLYRGTAGRGGVGSASASALSGNSKMQQLKMEARVTSSRRQPPPAMASKERSGFGAAVAFANTGKKVAGKRKTAPATKTVSLHGGKRLKVPEIKKTASINTQKRLKMLKKGQSTFRR
ncbi:MAG: hypothetical protein SGARI_005735 [Bacillariaceae sp.]